MSAPVDPKWIPLIKTAKALVEVLPVANNFDTVVNEWRTDVAQMLDSKDARQRFRQGMNTFRRVTTTKV